MIYSPRYLPDGFCEVRLQAPHAEAAIINDVVPNEWMRSRSEGRGGQQNVRIVVVDKDTTEGRRQ